LVAWSFDVGLAASQCGGPDFSVPHLIAPHTGLRPLCSALIAPGPARRPAPAVTVPVIHSHSTPHPQSPCSRSRHRQPHWSRVLREERNGSHRESAAPSPSASTATVHPILCVQSHRAATALGDSAPIVLSGSLPQCSVAAFHSARRPPHCFALHGTASHPQSLFFRVAVTVAGHLHPESSTVSSVRVRTLKACRRG
jgi:hypothetical protein